MTMKINLEKQKAERTLLGKVVILCLLILVSIVNGYGENAHVLQEGRITGLVKDAKGEPLIGVTIAQKGNSTNGTMSDIDGKFAINASVGDVLIASYLGMKKVEVEITNNQPLTIVMEDENDHLLDEIVVIGYGAVKRSNLSGAVSTVSSKDMQKLPAANLSQALQGNVPGMHTQQSDRNPGAAVSMTIRGGNSFAGSSTPLYIVDGSPVASNGAMSAINPDDIETMTILKDASSTAIYGARAANGVILITTKSGKIGKPVVNVSAYWGIKRFNNPIDMMNADEFAQLRRDSYTSDGVIMPSNAFLDTELYMLSQGRSTNWWDEVTNRNSLTQNYQVSFSSGTETTKVRVGLGLYDEEGIVKNTGFTRANLRLNAEQKLNKRVTFSTFNNISLQSIKGADAVSVLFPAMVGNPMSPIKNEDGEYYAMIQNALGTPRANPVAFATLPKIKTMQPLINSSVSLDVDIMDGLRARTQLSGGLDSYRKNRYVPIAISAEDESIRTSGGYAEITTNVNYNWTSETTLMYNKTFKDIHNINAVAGFSLEKNRYEESRASATGFASDAYESHSLGSGSGPARKPFSKLTEWSFLSYIGRAIYTLKDRYILTGTMRIDGSSRFGKDNKYGYFPSVAAAWRVSEENFMKSIDWVSDLKVRSSYGLTGNSSAIAAYASMSELTYTNYNFDGMEAPGYYEKNLPSPNLKWETTKQLDLGLDVGILQNRVYLTFDYYHKKTTDMLRTIELPGSIGFASAYANLGDLQNNGVEIGLSSVNMTGAFYWKSSLIFSANKNKVLSFGDGSERYGTEHWVGKPLGIGNRYLIEKIGIWQLGEETEAKKYGAVPGDVKYRDTNDDGKIDDKDRQFIGSLNPDFYGSFTNDFSYKNFDLNVFMTFSSGRDVFNGLNYSLLSGAAADNNRKEMLDRWTSTNPTNKYPRASSNKSNRAHARSSEFLEDASYLKIKAITLGYTVPSNILSKNGMSSLRVYGSVTNPFTFTKYTGMDPEDDDIATSERKSSYPINTTFTLGLQVQF